MKKTYIIPRLLEKYPEGGMPPIEADEVMYSPVGQEMVHVLLWERYPSYDMIFGVPTTINPRHEKEMAFFVIRRAGTNIHIGNYLDLKESQAMLKGFQMILEASKEHSPHLWNSQK